MVPHTLHTFLASSSIPTLSHHSPLIALPVEVEEKGMQGMRANEFTRLDGAKGMLKVCKGMPKVCGLAVARVCGVFMLRELTAISQARVVASLLSFPA